MIRFYNPFRRPSLAQANADLLQDAQHSMAQHQAAAEYHEAMILMYTARIERLAEMVPA